MIGGHLGNKVSDLLDGQLSRTDEDRAWEHVHSCHYCRDLVEREGWVKTRLAGLSLAGSTAPDRLKDALVGAQAGLTPGDALLAMNSKPRRGSLVAIGGGAAGAAVLGVLALGAAPANAPAIDRRGPVTNLVTPTPAPNPTPAITRRAR
jgi:predicted anti-sigma-YlaC factor YlaD